MVTREVQLGESCVQMLRSKLGDALVPIPTIPLDSTDSFITFFGTGAAAIDRAMEKAANQVLQVQRAHNATRAELEQVAARLAALEQQLGDADLVTHLKWQIQTMAEEIEAKDSQIREAEEVIKQKGELEEDHLRELANKDEVI
jgi:hypothetical protein